MEKTIKILSTKTLSNKNKAIAKDLNCLVFEQDFIRIESALNPQKEKRITELFTQSSPTVLFTSGNAVNQVFTLLDKTIELPLNWQVYCLYGATKDALSPYITNENFLGTAKNAQALCQIIKTNTPTNCIFFSGNIRGNLLPETFSELNIPLQEIVVYNTIEKPQEINENYEAILFYSPSGVRSFFSRNKIKDNILLVAIGNTTAAAIQAAGCPKNKILIADFPSPENMITLALNHFKKNKNNLTH